MNQEAGPRAETKESPFRKKLTALKETLSETIRRIQSKIKFEIAITFNKDGEHRTKSGTYKFHFKKTPEKRPLRNHDKIDILDQAHRVIRHAELVLSHMPENHHHRSDVENNLLHLQRISKHEIDTDTLSDGGWRTLNRFLVDFNDTLLNIMKQLVPASE